MTMIRMLKDNPKINYKYYLFILIKKLMFSKYLFFVLSLIFHVILIRGKLDEAFILLI